MNNKVKLKGQFSHFLKWPLYLSIFWILISTVIMFIDIRTGLVALVATVLFLSISTWIYFYHSPSIAKALAEFGADFSQIQRQMIHELDVPYSLLDTKGKILWTNDAMDMLIDKGSTRNRYITDVFDDIAVEKLDLSKGDKEFHIANGDRYYRVVIKEFKLNTVMSESGIAETVDENADFVNMYLFDETDMRQLRNQSDDEKLVSGLVYIDNYDEALQSVEDVRRTMLFALVDRKINKYISSIDGIVRKVENDKYFIAVKAKYVKIMQSNKFSLLDDVKTVNMGNDMPVTISIGLGMGGDTYLKNSEYARAAMDMALGRGGDQAVIKDGGKIYYYGGKSKSVEKNTRVKARVKAQALRELMLTRETIMVMGHKVGDMDSFGASIGIYRAAKSLGKKVYIVINGMNSTASQMFGKFGVDSGYEEDLFISSEEALTLIMRNTLLVVVDVNRAGYTECPELIKKTQSIVVLDHHRQSADVIDNALLSYIEPYASSTCELVAEIVQYIEDGVRLKQQEADAMYGGITVDTNNFTNRTGVRTFEAAAYLRRSGADVTRVRKMFRDDMTDYKAKAKAIQQAEVFKDNFAITTCPSEGIKMPTVIGAQTANELLNIKGIKASFVCTEYDGMIYVSARSIDEVNVQLIMERLGGGGHINLAATQLKGCTCAEARELIKETINGMIEEGDL